MVNNDIRNAEQQKEYMDVLFEDVRVNLGRVHGFTCEMAVEIYEGMKDLVRGMGHGYVSVEKNSIAVRAISLNRWEVDQILGIITETGCSGMDSGAVICSAVIDRSLDTKDNRIIAGVVDLTEFDVDEDYMEVSE